MSELTLKILQLDETLSRMSKEAAGANEAIENDARKQAEALVRDYEKRCDDIRKLNGSGRINEQEKPGHAFAEQKMKLLSTDERRAVAETIFLHIRKSICATSS